MTNRDDLAKLIDHTLLKPEATAADVSALAAEAGELGTYSICVSPSHLPVDVPDGVHVATVVGFPSGAVKAEVKSAEAARAVSDGAGEVDMVINIALAKEGRFDDLTREIEAVRGAVPKPGVLKVIIESAALGDAEIVSACESAEKAGADFVKTSTGFHPAGGASVHAVRLMHQTVGGRLGIKASGGIRSLEAAERMIAAGATRLGLSASAAILAEAAESPGTAGD
ncbi:MAG: deoxyribose-phosphate aldolase [Corynebacterium sp.]|uniref:deoxyribose-phosphate aldolase n=1 Tax=Corynebacterium sp. TaxID=1720 RepID=UPI003F9CAD19